MCETSSCSELLGGCGRLRMEEGDKESIRQREGPVRGLRWMDGRAERKGKDDKGNRDET